MRKPLRLLFCVFALIACFQLTGVEEAYCNDSVAESGCQDCLTCAGHQFTGIANPVSLPGIFFSGYAFSPSSSLQIINPPLNIFRPPIVR